MPLKPDSAAIVALASSLLAFPDNALTDEEASTSYKHTMRGFKPPAGEVEQVERCWEEKVNEHITVRIYVPEVAEDLKPLPLVVYYHGGGWVSGDLDMHDSTCRRIANRAKVSVVNVDYRLAPESKFPAAYDDAYVAAIWARDHAAEFSADPTRLALTGSSAGGNLAAAVTLHARDRGDLDVSLQGLIYPVMDSAMDTDSYRTYAKDYYLEAAVMQWFWQQYIDDPADLKDTRVSILSAESFVGLPPALMITAEFDPLRDEGEEYVRRLHADGVDAQLIRYDGQIHGFMGLLGAVADAEIALNKFADDIAEHFSQNRTTHD